MSSFFSRLSRGLSRSRDGLAQMLPVNRDSGVSEADWQEIEDALIMADCGAELAMQLVLRARRERRDPLGSLHTAMQGIFHDPEPVNWPQDGPLVLLVVGVNGTGKTTTIGKLSTLFARQGKRVLIAAADTFRAAAVDQLAIWADRAGADLVRQAEGADPAAVAFDAVQRGGARGYDLVIIDTAGRVQTDKGLMQELAKVRRVVGKAVAGAPHEVWHIVDAGTGQNGIVQVEQFRKVSGTTGLIVTKLDGSGKGGVVLQLARTFALPIRYIGVGETQDDLLPFDSGSFISSLLPVTE